MDYCAGNGARLFLALLGQRHETLQTPFSPLLGDANPVKAKNVIRKGCHQASAKGVGQHSSAICEKFLIFFPPLAFRVQIGSVTIDATSWQFFSQFVT